MAMIFSSNREVRVKIRVSKRNYIRIARKSKTNPKGLYQLYLFNTQEKVISAEVADGHITDDGNKMSSCFSEYFLPICTSKNRVHTQAVLQIFLQL